MSGLLLFACFACNELYVLSVCVCLVCVCVCLVCVLSVCV